MEGMTKSERFVEERKDYWCRLEAIIKKAHNGRVSSLSGEEIRDFPDLYRHVCTDSELAKTLELSPDTVDYIMGLVRFSHNILYSPPKKTINDIIRFFTSDFSISFRKNIKPIAFVFTMFFSIALITFITILRNPEYASNVLPENLITMMKQSYSGDISKKRDVYSNIEMSGFYIRNNISIGFMSFVLGITFGAGTIIIVCYNALTLGAVFGLVVSSGYGKNLFAFVTAHSAFELMGLCLTAGAGLAMGLSLIHGNSRGRAIALSEKARELTPVLFTGALSILLAAFIEGFLSPTKAPYWIKLSVALSSLALIVFFSLKYIIFKPPVKILKGDDDEE
jgi:uncharacterized membrane protein SpoIIM required for sporulation